MRVLVARLDSLGDVLLAGPAVRAVASRADEVIMLCGPRGRSAAELLPAVDRLVEWCAPWIDPEPEPVSPAQARHLIEAVRELRVDMTLIFTSFHQDPLPLALLLRLAGVPWIGAISEDYPGSLLDLRHRAEGDGDIPEAERALSLAAAAGFQLPTGDDGGLRIRGPLPDVSELTGAPGYVVVHVGASVPAREWPDSRCGEAVRGLAETGRRVVVTGLDPHRTAPAAGEWARDLGGRTNFAQLAAVLAGAATVVAPNSGPAHLAAAVGTPVVSLFAPTVPAARWAPYGVPTVLLGDQQAPCHGTRARTCPVPGHPCLSTVTGDDVIVAVDRLAEVTR